MPFEYAAFLSYRHSATGLGAWVHHFHGILEAKIRERIPKRVSSLIRLLSEMEGIKEK
jgi:hypothetical protein